MKWLLGKTRDRKRFFLLFKENVSYGFHRNGFGLRWIGGLIGLLSVAWMGVAFQAFDSQQRVALSTEQIVTMSFALAITLAWIAYFNETRVKQAAHAYADMLLRACDELR